VLKNTWQDRKLIRDAMTLKACFPYRDFTPVLVMYWTKETLLQYLVPCDQETLQKLYPLNGIDENGTGWEPLKDTFQFLKDKISQVGDWMEEYFIDTCDEDGRPLPPVSTPPGTVLIITGYIPQEEVRVDDILLDFVQNVEDTGMVLLQISMDRHDPSKGPSLAQAYLRTCAYLKREPRLWDPASTSKEEYDHEVNQT
jgi:hypothetical protein